MTGLVGSALALVVLLVAFAVLILAVVVKVLLIGIMGFVLMILAGTRLGPPARQVQPAKAIATAQGDVL